jgi:hypothetical protein
MPKYRVEALEKFLVRTVYHVDAVNKLEAVRKCRNGDVPYEEHEIEEGDDEWVDTTFVRERSN